MLKNGNNYLIAAFFGSIIDKNITFAIYKPAINDVR